MKKLLRTVLKTANRERGYSALAVVLVLMLVGMLTIPALLAFVRTGLETGMVVEEKTLEFYAADAGIEDAMWRIKHDRLPQWMLGNWGESAYAREYSPSSDPPYPVLEVNNRDVEVTIKPQWVLEGLETPKPGQGREPHDSLVTVGDVIEYVGGKGNYQISIIYDGSVGNVKIERIGCWLPPGFTYESGSSNLERPGQPFYCVPRTFTHNDGTAITWEYHPALDYDRLPSQGTKKIVTFRFTPADSPQGAFSWIRTNRSDIYLSWDVDVKVYKITSKAVSASGKHTKVTAYSSKNEFRLFGSAMTGDCVPVGCTLMRDANNDTGFSSDRDRKERLYRETWATVSGIPSDAKVEKIFLYWSGWKCKPWNAWNLTEAQLQALPAEKGVNKVALQVEVGGYRFPTPPIITASVSQVIPNGTRTSQHGWSYSCYADITNLVTDFFKNQGVSFNGNARYTIGHWDVRTSTPWGEYRYRLFRWNPPNHSGETEVARTRYPLGSYMDGRQRDTGYEDEGSEDEWAYSAWSVVIFYTSPQTKGRQLYLYDTFRYCDNYQTLVFTIKGFLAPEDVLTDPQAARLTCFVGEGDFHYTGDNIRVNGVNLSRLPANPWNNIWNSRSDVNGDGTVDFDGIDIDTYIFGATGIIRPGDSEAEVRLPTDIDIWNLVYIILSFRSETTIGGTLTYKVEVGGE